MDLNPKNLTPRARSAIILSIFAAFGIGTMLFLHSRFGPTLVAGKSCPAFRLKAMNGSYVAKDELEGKNAALLFVNPSCRICQATIRKICTIAGPSTNVVVISLADASQTIDYAKTVCSLGTWLYGDNTTVRQVFGIRALPTLMVLQPSGRVAHISVGSDVAPGFFKFINERKSIAIHTNKGLVQ